MVEPLHSTQSPPLLHVPGREAGTPLQPQRASARTRSACALMIAACAVLWSLLGCKGGDASKNADGGSAASSAPATPSASAAIQATPLAGAERIAILNDVSDCTAIKPYGLFTLGNVVLGRFALQSLNSRGDCGCMSSVLAYSMVQKFEVPDEAKAVGATGEYERVFGTIDPRDQDKELWLVVSTDRSHFEGRAWTLKLYCKGPD
jgi:hypothetical protein